MKKTTLVLFLLFGSNSFAQKPEPSIFETIIIDFFKVFSEYDAKYLDQTCTPDFELYDVGLVWNADSVKNYLKTSKKPYKRVNNFEILKLNQRKSTAWLSYWNTGTFYKQDGTNMQVKWLESAIFEKRKGQWKIVQLHSTRVK